MIPDALKRFLAEEDGPTSVEYAIMLMLILLAVLTTVQSMADTVRDSFQDSSDQINAAI